MIVAGFLVLVVVLYEGKPNGIGRVISVIGGVLVKTKRAFANKCKGSF